ncbi:ABC transporter permease [Salipiger mangrovisoli]|uniref:MlaE family lipid ABC transporter permease subunit n=1 Tax=Salipiger mangrovisoli TaxID=2865933 RepID=A0ABR9WZR2_9RHOB|nr:MlaE family lipid ABC transporter permease subunit [Salipiger mangrovisoli]MBE9636779.1 MlaE family lipid ABC transporter permease subunit [Salipiger mangrovisoli]
MSTTGLQTENGESAAGQVIGLSGALTVHELAALHGKLAEPTLSPTIDLSGVTRIDTAGAWALAEFEQRVAAAGGTLRYRGASEAAELLLGTVRRALPVPEPEPPSASGPRALLEATGRRVVAAVTFLRGLLEYLGMFVAGLVRVLLHPREFRLTALVAHCDDVGLRAVPIVSLMAFLIGVVLAFQGATQLRQFGAEVFVVDLIAISVLRELGILLTAIIVAGRTASAFTAAIGSMKMRQEIDAMRTLGLDPVTVLFVPRILALLLMLPILGLIADVMGLFGGALMSWIELGISPSMFRTRLVADTDISNVIAGLIKAPVFALIIGVVGCHAGMQVKGDAESLGRMTSSAVVTAIFAVIVADALFSIFFAEVGL